MTDSSDRPQDEPRPDGTYPEPTPRADDGSVLAGFSWDDPAGGAAPVRPEDEDRSGSSAVGSDGQTPAQYPPAAPYPPAGSQASGGSQPLDEQAAAFGEQPGPYGQVPGDRPDGSDGYGQQPPAQPWSEQPSGEQSGQQSGGYGQPPYPQQPYGGQASGQGYGQPYGPAGAGYGQSSPYSSTPQPYSYGGGAMTPEAEKARSNAILWTILNGVAIFLCGNLLAIPGVVLAAFGISKASSDVESSRNLTRWSWILFAAGFALWILLIIGVVALGFAGTLAGAGGF